MLHKNGFYEMSQIIFYFQFFFFFWFKYLGIYRQESGYAAYLGIESNLPPTYLGTYPNELLVTLLGNVCVLKGCFMFFRNNVKRDTRFLVLTWQLLLAIDILKHSFLKIV